MLQYFVDRLGMPLGYKGIAPISYSDVWLAVNLGRERAQLARSRASASRYPSSGVRGGVETGNVKRRLATEAAEVERTSERTKRESRKEKGESRELLWRPRSFRRPRRALERRRRMNPSSSQEL